MVWQEGPWQARDGGGSGGNGDGDGGDNDNEDNNDDQMVVDLGLLLAKRSRKIIMILNDTIAKLVDQTWYLLDNQDTASIIILVYEKAWILIDKKSWIYEDILE